MGGIRNMLNNLFLRSRFFKGINGQWNKRIGSLHEKVKIKINAGMPIELLLFSRKLNSGWCKLCTGCNESDK